MVNQDIAIVIPTARYSKYLDRSIASCLSLEFVDVGIFININSQSKAFKKSKYWRSPYVNWRYIDTPTKNMHDSFNDAVEHSTGNWIFLLSDDDILHTNFLKHIDFKKFTKDSLFLTRINIIDENDLIIHENSEYSSKIYDRDEAMSLFFSNYFHNHLSLMMFSREMFYKAGKFRFTGYPNGYYIDTVFHGIAIANSDKVYTSTDIMMSRRESSFQQSAKFIYGKEVNQYFNMIVDHYLSDSVLYKLAMSKYHTRQNYLESIIKTRFFTEWRKLHNPTYNTYVLTKIKFLWSYLWHWDIGLLFKCLSIGYIILPECLRNQYMVIKKKI